MVCVSSLGKFDDEAQTFADFLTTFLAHYNPLR